MELKLKIITLTLPIKFPGSFVAAGPVLIQSETESKAEGPFNDPRQYKRKDGYRYTHVGVTAVQG